jgi:hypothetical protein
MHGSSSFYFYLFIYFQFYDGCHIGNHPQGYLAMFGYRPAMKVEIY